MTTTVPRATGGSAASPPPQHPGGSALLGHARALQRDTIVALEQISDGAADGVMGFRIGPQPAVAVSTPATVREVLIDRADDYGRGRRQTRALTPLMGRGLLVSEGELHTRQRRIVLPHLSPRQVPRHADTIVAEAERYIAGWTEPTEVDLVAEMNSLTMNIVTQLLFSADSRDNRELARAITEAFEWEMHAITSVVAFPLWVPTARNRRARRNIDLIRRWIADFIHRRRAEQAGESPPEVTDLLGDLMGTRYEDGTGMPDDLLLDEALTAWGASQETSADAQAWTLYLLATHPEIRQRVRDEVDSVLGERTVTFDDLRQLPFCMQVFKEAMRLYPPASMIPRQAVRDTTVGGYRVKAGTMVFINAYSLHRRPEVYTDPERFDPDRFARTREKALPKGAYLPFGTGGNVCPGSHLANMEGHLLTALLAQRLTVELLPGQRIRPELLVNLRPSPGVRARVSPRSRAGG
ncbi:cytochrome P450 [Streptomyces triticirhizae]|uniref:Cytochrome P450 n=1 Tax=Streptomyces triticirhizae TaxID=2483353 RepID=A0A3M2LID0_9ACTN|nr:cytochrome P450 [Streptomyces triticirhizae]RMI37237.1 cytochrome P450 [Streptomyces triticirhizae]